MIKEEKIAVKTLLKNFPSFHPFESCWKSNCIIISLVQVDIHCKKNELQIVGYYQANEHINDNRWVKSTSKNIKFFMNFKLEKGLLTCQKSLGEIGLDKQICMSFTFKKGCKLEHTFEDQLLSKVFMWDRVSQTIDLELQWVSHPYNFFFYSHCFPSHKRANKKRKEHGQRGLVWLRWKSFCACENFSKPTSFSKQVYLPDS